MSCLCSPHSYLGMMTFVMSVLQVMPSAADYSSCSMPRLQQRVFICSNLKPVGAQKDKFLGIARCCAAHWSSKRKVPRHCKTLCSTLELPNIVVPLKAKCSQSSWPVVSGGAACLSDSQDPRGTKSSIQPNTYFLWKDNLCNGLGHNDSKSHRIGDFHNRDCHNLSSCLCIIICFVSLAVLYVMSQGHQSLTTHRAGSHFMLAQGNILCKSMNLTHHCARGI